MRRCGGGWVCLLLQYMTSAAHCARYKHHVSSVWPHLAFLSGESTSSISTFTNEWEEVGRDSAPLLWWMQRLEFTGTDVMIQVHQDMWSRCWSIQIKVNQTLSACVGRKHTDHVVSVVCCCCCLTADHGSALKFGGIHGSGVSLCPRWTGCTNRVLVVVLACYAKSALQRTWRWSKPLDVWSVSDCLSVVLSLSGRLFSLIPLRRVSVTLLSCVAAAALCFFLLCMQQLASNISVLQYRPALQAKHSIPGATLC